MLVETSSSDVPRQYGPYTLYKIWPGPDESTRREILDFWSANDAMPAAAADQDEHRSQQVVVVARDSHTSKIAGISTAIAAHIGPLGFPCFYYRTFVAPQHRNSWVLSKEIFLSSYDVLNRRFQQGFDADVLGLFIELHNDSLHRHLTYAVWQLDGMNVVYIGKNAKGVHRRVWYFEGARVP